MAITITGLFPREKNLFLLQVVRVELFLEKDPQDCFIIYPLNRKNIDVVLYMALFIGGDVYVDLGEAMHS